MTHRSLIVDVLGYGLLGSVALACAGESNSSDLYGPPGPPGPAPTEQQPTDPGAPSVSPASDLMGKLPAGAVPVGLAITPAASYYVLDSNSGLYRVRSDAAELVFATTDLDVRFGLSPALEFTDVASIDENRFLITATNDGFMLDLAQGTFESYFCYLPAAPAEGEATMPPERMSTSQILQSGGIEAEQRTESVAYNSLTGAIFAQPQTFRLDTGAVAGSEVFMFDNTGGQPVLTVGMDLNFIAGGMVTDDDTLILGQDNILFRATLDQGYNEIQRLNEGVRIVGMARDAAGRVVVLDQSGSLITFAANAF